MATKQTKQDKLTNSFIADLICANYDYHDGKISEDTLKFFVKRICLLAISNLDAKHHAEFCTHPTIKQLRIDYYL